jgi:hypothetical protein
MSMYGDALKKLDTGQYIKLTAGQNKTLKILDHPYVATKAWEDNVSNRFYWLVWDYDMQSVRILEQGKSVFDQIARIIEKYPNGEQMPSAFDINIEREGGGQNDTKYFVTPFPTSGEMPDIKQLINKTDELRHTLREKNKAISLKDIIAGAKPEVITAGTAAPALPEPKRPTHADAEALDAQRQPKGEDVVIEDLDTDKNIDLDEIPF